MTDEEKKAKAKKKCEAQKEYAKNNPEKIAAYYEKNREAIRIKKKKYDRERIESGSESLRLARDRRATKILALPEEEQKALMIVTVKQ